MEKTTVKERMELTRKLADELSPLLKEGWKLECVHSYVKKRFELKVRDKSSGIDDFSYSYDETFTEGVYEAKEYFTDRLKYLAKEYSDKPKKKSRRDSDSLPSSSPTPFTLPPNLGVAMDLGNLAAFQYYGLGATGRDYSIEQLLASSSPLGGRFVEQIRNHAREPLPTILDNENVVGDIEYTANGHTNTLTPDPVLQTMQDTNNSNE